MEIPKIIHYCWFGGHDLSANELRCIESWKKMFPDYEIVRWDECNFQLTENRYVAQAAEREKWAFVSDYARFDILYKHGGLYFDTDVEVISPMDDIVARGPFMGVETAPANKQTITVNPGLGLGAIPGMELYREVLESYAEPFVNNDGTLNEETITVRLTRILKAHGLQNVADVQCVRGVKVYPADFFNPKDFLTGEIRRTVNTRSIHHFAMSWYSEPDMYKHDIVVWLRKHGVRGVLAYKIAALMRAVRYPGLR